VRFVLRKQHLDYYFSRCIFPPLPKICLGSSHLRLGAFGGNHHVTLAGVRGGPSCRFCENIPRSRRVLLRFGIQGEWMVNRREDKCEGNQSRESPRVRDDSRNCILRLRVLARTGQLEVHRNLFIVVVLIRSSPARGRPVRWGTREWSAGSEATGGHGIRGSIRHRRLWLPWSGTDRRSTARQRFTRAVSRPSE